MPEKSDRAAERREMVNKDAIINQIVERLCGISDPVEMKQKLTVMLNKYDFCEKTTALAVASEDLTAKTMRLFLIAKKVEGCADTTIRYYSTVLNGFFLQMQQPLEEMNADTIRYYLAEKAMRKGISKVTQNNELHVLKSFFKWACGENYIDKDPTVPIRGIKQDKRIKKAFSEREMEDLRDACNTSRERALLEIALSTGCRVSEISRMNRKDIRGDEMTVLGKGSKERVVYLNEKSRRSVERYLEERKDENSALFVGTREPHERMSRSALENTIRDIGKRAGVENTHPHRFRRTCATWALNRGMPIEEVQQILGHENIGTTTIYARSNSDNVKNSHKKYCS